MLHIVSSVCRYCSQQPQHPGAFADRAVPAWRELAVAKTSKIIFRLCDSRPDVLRLTSSSRLIQDSRAATPRSLHSSLIYWRNTGQSKLKR